MKHNKLLEVAMNKTDRQCLAIEQFLQRNKLKSKDDMDDEAPLPVITQDSRMNIEEQNQTTYDFQNF